MKKLLLTAVAVLSMATMAQADEHSHSAGPEQPKMIPITEGVYQFSLNHYNNLVVLSDEGVIITDPSSAEHAAALREEIRKLTDLPVEKVIYTHDHFDHSRGGQIFKAEGAEFIAQENCLELMPRDLENSVVMPDVTYDEMMSVKLGDKQVDLHYFGSNDGKCMSVVHMPKDKVLLAVDWHLQGYVNEGYRLPEHDYVGVLRTMERVRDELEFDHVIAGHMPKSSPEQFEEDYRFNKALFDAVYAGMQAGKTVAELKKEIRLPEFSHWFKYEENFPAHVERMAYSIWHGN